MNMKIKWIIGIVIFILLATIVIARLSLNRDLPVKLHGVWETSHTDYKNRYLYLSKNAIGFGTGDIGVDWYGIISVDETVKRNKVIYIIEFRKDDGAEFKRSLYYYPVDSGIIKFKNQEEIEWVLSKCYNFLSTRDRNNILLER